MRSLLPVTLTALALALAGCTPDDSTIDLDEDGYTADVDCDDDDASIHPDADEVCDDIDNNCDGVADLDATDRATFYADADGDGYYGDAITIEDCSAPEGFGEAADDCDDLDPDTNPAGTETCDGVDNDCDDLIDDDDDSLSGDTLETWYADGDSDGYGSDDDTIEACDMPSGYVTEGGDCDDEDADSNPDAIWYGDLDGDGYGNSVYTAAACEPPDGFVANSEDCDDLDAAVSPDAVEICDEIDNDCDAAIDDDDDDVDESTFTTWYSDSDSDGYGDPESTVVQSCAAPSSYTDDATDCDDESSDVNPAAEEVCSNGIDDDCSGDANDCGIKGDFDATTVDYVISSSTSGDYTGYSTEVGDFDGDGYGDLLVSAYYTSVSGSSGAGAAYLVHGPLTGDVSVSNADAEFLGGNTYDYAGKYFSAGDLDGDGYDDIAISAYSADTNASGGGSVYVLYGSVSGFSGSYDLTSDPAAEIAGNSSSDYLGESVRIVSDMDGDGDDELIVGMSGYDSGSSYSIGAIGIYAGSSTRLSGDYDGDDAPILITGTTSYDYLGDDRTIGRSVDANGDGLGDLLVGVYGYDAGASSAGGVFVVMGAATSASGIASITDVASAAYLGATSSDYLATAVGGVGDVNGDGYEDFSMGADGYDGSSGSYSIGAQYLVYGSATGVTGTTSIASAAAAVVEGTTSYDYVGAEEVAGTDLDADGYSDLVVGGHGIDPNSVSSGGQAGVFYGPLTGTMTMTVADATISGAASSDYVGKSVAVGDLDADGTDDLIVGAYGAEEAYVLLGGGL